MCLFLFIFLLHKNKDVSRGDGGEGGNTTRKIEVVILDERKEEPPDGNCCNAINQMELASDSLMFNTTYPFLSFSHSLSAGSNL